MLETSASASDSAPVPALRKLVDAGDAALASEIATLLDGLAHAQRLEAIFGLSASRLRKLYAQVEGAMRVGLVDIVPEATEPLRPVRHYGQNSLPVFRRFEKRFYRTGDTSCPVAGANFQTLSPLTGPGYFCAREDEQRGEVLIDYTMLPQRVPSGWPALQPNDHGVSQLVYGFMVDTLRRVSEHVTIGRAARHGKPMSAFFILCREATY